MYQIALQFAAQSGVEEHVGRVGRGRRGNDAYSDQRIDGKIHVSLSAMSLSDSGRAPNSV